MLSRTLTRTTRIVHHLTSSPSCYVQHIRPRITSASTSTSTSTSTFQSNMSSTATTTMKRVLVPIADGSEDIESVTLIDVLRRAGADVTVASVMPQQRTQVKMARGTNVTADTHIDSCTSQTYDLVALPGGMPGAEHLRDSATLIDILKKQAVATRLYAAVCASPAVVFSPHGLLSSTRSATCHPSFATKLQTATKSAYTSDELISGPRVVRDGHVITSMGPGTSMEFAIALVEALYGNETAQKVAQPMYLHFQVDSKL